MKTGTFTIIVPVFNEAGCIWEIVHRVSKLRNCFPGNVVLILVDDGSTDGSSSVLQDVSTEQWISCISIKRRRGQHSALIAGFNAALRTADLEIIGTMDADMDPGPEAFLRLLPHIAVHDLLIGRRIPRPRSSLRTIVASVLRILCFLLRPNRIHDHGSMFRIYRAELGERIVRYSHHGEFVAGLSLLCARSPVEIPVESFKPVLRASRYSIYRIAHTGWQMIKLILHHPCGIGINRPDTRPLHRAADST